MAGSWISTVGLSGRLAFTATTNGGWDAYVVDLDGLVPSKLTTLAAYWYSMWSHRRNQAWKGYLQVELSPSEDARAAALLLLIAPAKETP